MAGSHVTALNQDGSEVIVPLFPKIKMEANHMLFIHCVYFTAASVVCDLKWAGCSLTITAVVTTAAAGTTHEQEKGGGWVGLGGTWSTVLNVVKGLWETGKRTVPKVWDTES